MFAFPLYPTVSLLLVIHITFPPSPRCGKLLRLFHLSLSFWFCSFFCYFFLCSMLYHELPMLRHTNTTAAWKENALWAHTISSIPFAMEIKSKTDKYCCRVIVWSEIILHVCLFHLFAYCFHNNFLFLSCGIAPIRMKKQNIVKT